MTVDFYFPIYEYFIPTATKYKWAVLRYGSVIKKKRSTVTYIMMIVNKIALVLSIIGALNWGLVGLFSFDLVAWICGGAATVVARIIYVLIALAGVWCISLLFMNDDEIEGAHTHA